VYEVAWLVDRGKPDPALSSAAKLFTSETTIKATMRLCRYLAVIDSARNTILKGFYRCKGCDDI